VASTAPPGPVTRTRVAPGASTCIVTDGEPTTPPEDGCTTPWDYCCEDSGTRAEHTLLLEFHGEGETPVAVNSLPGLRLLDLVVAKGRLTHDEHGNVSLVATGWLRRERPELREGLDWPTG